MYFYRGNNKSIMSMSLPITITDAQLIFIEKQESYSIFIILFIYFGQIRRNSLKSKGTRAQTL